MFSAGKFFTEEDELLIIEAINQAEQKTSGEIRVHVDRFCWGDPLKKAQKIFSRLKMHQTKERNGVLIYIATFHRKMAVIGDAGIHAKVGNEFWNRIVQNMVREFQLKRHAGGMCDCVKECGEQLSKYFPPSKDDSNELSNTISY